MNNLELAIAVLDINLAGTTKTFDERGLWAVRSAWEEVRRALQEAPAPQSEAKPSAGNLPPDALDPNPTTKLRGEA